MATITSLTRFTIQPQIARTGATVSGSENWTMKLDGFVTTVEADALIAAVGSGNSFGFTVIGSVHPSNSSLQILGLSTNQMEPGKTYSNYMVTTNFSNDKDASDSDVDPTLAQDSYSFDSIDYEVVVTETLGASKATAGETLGVTAASEAIQNTNGIGIVLTESAQIQQVTIVRSESSFSLKTASKHVGRVNSSQVTLVGETFDAGSCKLDRWSAQDMYDVDGKLYYRVTYVISLAEETDFFERQFIMRGAVDKNGKPAPIALGYLADTEYKLQEDGTFFALADQVDPNKFFAKSFVTKKSSNWDGAVSLQASPNPNITTLSGGDGTFGLQNPQGNILSGG